MTGEFREADVKALCDLAKYAKVRVKISAYYALGKKQPPHDELIPVIRRLLEAYGPDRLMWASDSPYQLTSPNSYGESIALVRDRLDFLQREIGRAEVFLQRNSWAHFGMPNGVQAARFLWAQGTAA